MRLSKVPLLVVEEHLINLNLLVNAYVDETDDYPKRWLIRYFMDTAYTQEDSEGNHGATIEFRTRKAAVEALAKLASAADSLVIEESS